MADVESPETFVEPLRGPWINDITRAELASAIRARDAAIRTEAFERAAELAAKRALEIRQYELKVKQEGKHGLAEEWHWSAVELDKLADAIRALAQRGEGEPNVGQQRGGGGGST